MNCMIVTFFMAIVALSNGFHSPTTLRAGLFSNVIQRVSGTKCPSIHVSQFRLNESRKLSDAQISPKRSIFNVTSSLLLRAFTGILDLTTQLFPLWVLASSLFGYFNPTAFNQYMHCVSPCLALTMGFMGMTLTGGDFLRVLSQPQYVLLGFLSQFTIMPLLAANIAKYQSLGPELSAGLILVGCAPGGTASNLVTLIARADVALSVTMTACSTIAASFMTPYLTSKLASQYVDVNRAALVRSTVDVVLAPVLGGLVLNKYIPKLTRPLSKVTPALSVLLVAFICGIPSFLYLFAFLLLV